MTTNREQLINELAKLYDDIDQCIGDIVDSRLKKDHHAEGKAIFRMEGLMVATLQDLECTIDHLGRTYSEDTERSYYKAVKSSEFKHNFKYIDKTFNKDTNMTTKQAIEVLKDHKDWMNNTGIYAENKFIPRKSSVTEVREALDVAILALAMKEN